MTVNIPKKLWHVWIGPKPAPKEWMDTWPEKHPDWEYCVIDNQALSSLSFKNQLQIDTYIQKGLYPGAADLIRYELLLEYGGFALEADSVCLNNTDELWTAEADVCYTVYENEHLRPGYVSPICAANPGNKFLDCIVNTLNRLKPTDCISPWRTTGNAFLAKMIETHCPDIVIFPSHYFIPKHYSTAHVRYAGADKVYADQKWGTTTNCY